MEAKWFFHRGGGLSMEPWLDEPEGAGKSGFELLSLADNSGAVKFEEAVMNQLTWKGSTCCMEMML